MLYNAVDNGPFTSILLPLDIVATLPSLYIPTFSFPAPTTFTVPLFVKLLLFKATIPIFLSPLPFISITLLFIIFALLPVLIKPVNIDKFVAVKVALFFITLSTVAPDSDTACAKLFPVFPCDTEISFCKSIPYLSVLNNVLSLALLPNENFPIIVELKTISAILFS